jgi:hypothetical protein
MKVHVFVATTQGLVAIQKIYSQDADIRSVVSIRGTSTVSPICNAYHHFVKKGVGIIENDFGGSAYRVNIDGNIDQGNSWQLAFYLAHALHAADMLGDGEVEAGDRVICASGEINTSEKSVLAVEQIPLKLQRAKSTIASWPAAINIQFLLPKANLINFQDGVNVHNKDVQIEWVTSLEQALKFVDIKPGAPPIESSKKSGSTKHKNTKVIQKTKRFYLGWAVAPLGLLTLSALLWMKGADNDGSANLAQMRESAHLLENQTQKADGAHDTLIAASDVLKTDTNDNKPASLRLYYTVAADCQKRPFAVKELSAINTVFAAAPHNKLCEIQFSPSINFATVIAINTQTHRFILATKGSREFGIPVPSQEANYFIVAIKPSLSVHAQQKLHAFLFNLPQDYQLGVQDIMQLADFSGFELKVFSHQLN